jgi:Ni/Fe-hydrogenase subunit HybB-like protein
MPAFIYPNEGEIQWSILIVIYPFITGLVAGAFIVSSFYHVFGLRVFKPVARFSLVTALAFLLVAPLPLQAHLGRPERAFEIFLTPHTTSAMAGFGYIWLFYLILVLGETWLVFRRDICVYARTATGPRKLIYTLLALGVTDVTPESRRHDERLIKILAGIGIPAAFVLHGYVGFIFGAIKANPWWSTPLMPVIFLMSAIVSGIALLIVLYVVVTTLRGAKVDNECVRALGAWLFGFLALDLALEGLELLSMMYEGEESWQAIRELIMHRIVISFVGVQLVFGALIPLAALGLISALKVRDWLRTRVIAVAAVFVVIGVFAMRWNVVIGGQMLSKSLRGFISYDATLGGREGILAAAAMLMLPLLIFSAITFLLPPWAQPGGLPPDGESGETPPGGGRRARIRRPRLMRERRGGPPRPAPEWRTF